MNVCNGTCYVQRPHIRYESVEGGEIKGLSGLHCLVQRKIDGAHLSI